MESHAYCIEISAECRMKCMQPALPLQGSWDRGSLLVGPVHLDGDSVKCMAVKLFTMCMMHNGMETHASKM